LALWHSFRAGSGGEAASMKIAIPKERRAHESRVAASPDTVKRLVGMGLEVVVEAGAGAGASYIDAAYSAAGASIAADAAAAMGTADIILKVQRPIIEEGGTSELVHMKSGAVLIGMLQPLQHPDEVAAYAKAGLVAFAMELIPRITRAQSMDVLSSQANLAGYRAVLDAATEFGRAFPMMMTAAGTIAPARVLVMGAGVAGLQAIATARRLGGVVSATDVRAVAKEQVESLGASFLTVDLEAMKAAETAGGYAKEMSEDFQRRQREHVHEALKKTDIVICTALIPGRKAPVLVTKEMVADMRPGSVIVDLAVEQGGNCEGSKLGKVVTTANGVRIVGHANVPSRIAVDASALYARNLFNFLGLIIDKDKTLKIDGADEIIKGTLLTQGGAVVHPALAPKAAAPASGAPGPAGGN
jgi:H+-translocating NAD(P) transhydrogenase subunit alpha